MFISISNKIKIHTQKDLHKILIHLGQARSLFLPQYSDDVCVTSRRIYPIDQWKAIK